MRLLFTKFKEILFGVLPIVFIVLLFQFILFISGGNTISKDVLYRFLISSVLIIIGLTLILFGLDISINKIAADVAKSLVKTQKLYLILSVTLVLGIIISIAEPDLLILAFQINEYSKEKLSAIAIILSISFGVGIMFMVSTLKNIFKLPLRTILYVMYGIIFILGFLLRYLNPDLFSIAFDSSAAVTGTVVVPFLLSFGIGLCSNDKNAKEEDNFGTVALAASGAILGSLIYLLIISKYKFESVTLITHKRNYASFFTEMITIKPLGYLFQALIATLPFLIIFIILEFTLLKDDKEKFINELKGFIYIFIGLTIFLTAANVGFMDCAKELGENIYSLNKWLVPFVAFLVGSVIMFSDSSVHVLTQQISSVTGGSIKKLPVLISLGFGVGISLFLLVLRTYFTNFTILIIVLGLYFISLLLTIVTPKLFIGMAFDSGSVSSGPMAATFVLAFIQGVSLSAKGIKISLGDVYGTMAVVTVMPIITIQILGIIYNSKLKKLNKQNEVIDNE